MSPGTFSYIDPNPKLVSTSLQLQRIHLASTTVRLSSIQLPFLKKLTLLISPLISTPLETNSKRTPSFCPLLSLLTPTRFSFGILQLRRVVDDSQNSLRHNRILARTSIRVTVVGASNAQFVHAEGDVQCSMVLMMMMVFLPNNDQR